MDTSTGFLHRVAGLTFRDRVKSLVIPEGLKLQLLHLHIKGGQLRWLRHLSRIASCVVSQLRRLKECPTRSRPWGRECLGISLEDLEEMAEEREVWAALLRLLQWIMDGWVIILKRHNPAPLTADH